MTNNKTDDESGVITLDKLKPGQECVITKVGGDGELRYRLLDMGLIPKTKVKIVKRWPILNHPKIFNLSNVFNSLLFKLLFNLLTFIKILVVFPI